MLNDGQQVKPYIAPNAPGLTLEAELDIGENAIPGSDFDVWELKAIKQPSLERLSNHSYLVHAAAAQPVPHQPQRHRSHIPKGARSGLARSGSRMISVFHIMRSNGKQAPQNIRCTIQRRYLYCSTRRRKAMQRPCETGSILRSNQSDKHTVGTGNVAEAKMLVKAARDIIIRIND